MKYKFIFICILILIIYLMFVLGMFKHVLTFFWGEKENYYIITEQFENNKEMFEKSLNELLKVKEEISVEVEKEKILVFEYDNNSKTEVLTEELYKYENTINLLKNLNLKDIHKYDNNVVYLFNSQILSGQYIAKIYDENQIKKFYNIDEIINLENNWYYFET